MNQRIIERAIQEAKKSNHPQRIGAVIFDKNKIISCGHNYAQRSVKSITKQFLNYPYSIHGEVDAILNAKRPLRGMSLIVIRLNKKGNLLLAKPCTHCLKYIDYVGLRKVYYSDQGDIYEL
jgi:deoxycytidylate deaminase